MKKVKIILDADVLIHFSKADMLSKLPSILPQYDYTILSVVYEETKTIRLQIDNQINYLKNITLIPFEPAGEMKKEFARLCKSYGRGESACMAYCRFTNNVIGSSNLKDIKTYCKEQSITFLTTRDFLYYAYKRGMKTKTQCDEFIQTVNKKGSKLPTTDIITYKPNNLV